MEQHYRSPSLKHIALSHKEFWQIQDFCIDNKHLGQCVEWLQQQVEDQLVRIGHLDIPEITLIAILDADKEGFLRSETSLIQTIGRAARNANGKVIMYADRITDSMQKAISGLLKMEKL